MILQINDKTNDSFIFNVASSSSAATGNNELMRIKGSGNVGIGTNNPIQKFHVRGATPAMIRVETDANTIVGQVSGIEFGNPAFSSANSAKILSTASATGNVADLQFYTTSGSTAISRLTITSNGNIGIGITNTTISSILTINPLVIDSGGFEHSNSPLTVTNQTITSTTVLNDPQPVLHLCRQGKSAQAYGARATFALSRYENSGVDSRTRLDLILTHVNYNTDKQVLTCLSSGNIGIGTTAPKASMELYSTTQTSVRLILSGQEYYQANNTSTDGIAFLCGVNRSGNNCILLIVLI